MKTTNLCLASVSTRFMSSIFLVVALVSLARATDIPSSSLRFFGSKSLPQKSLGVSSSCGPYMNYTCSSGTITASYYPEVLGKDQCTGVARCGQDTYTSGTCDNGVKFTCMDSDETLLYEKWENADCTGVKQEFFALNVSVSHCVSDNDEVEQCDDDCGRATLLRVSGSKLYQDTYTDVGCTGQVCDTQSMLWETCYSKDDGYVKFYFLSDDEISLSIWDDSNFCTGSRKEYFQLLLNKFPPLPMGYCVYDDCVTPSSAVGFKVLAGFLASALLFIAFL
eukprot:TRINITY_DN80261_c0_g1_i1.p1 TRINITY_DN80261_c0_g1~~TRINITY_DN80261_c0_g1_i1.p1  ORF type:complete len:279 (+),score=39.77 TRINITY_DN80261_c0_g1_i1:1368-2204(+)